MGPFKTGRAAQADGDQGELARRQQIEKIVNSAAFRERDALKRLLNYLADRTFEGTADGLKEYTIGVEVFHKAEAYDPQRDGSVRQHIGKLRQKLEEYYLTEGPADQIQIDLPKRQFRLNFQESKADQTDGQRFTVWAAGIGVILLVVGAYWLGTMRRPAVAPDLDPSVRAIWGPFLDGSRSTVMCLGTPLFFRNRSLRMRDSHLNNTESTEAQAKIADFVKRMGVDSLVPTFDYTGIGEAYAAVGISRMFTAAHREASMTRGNVLSWNELRNENVIFLGSPKANPQLAAITESLDFVADRDRSVVKNLHPRTGERDLYERINGADLNATEDYVLIDRLPGIGSGSMLILEGSSTGSNWAAADYLTGPATAKELVSRIKLADGSIPPFFQLILHVKYQNAVPTRIEFTVFHQVRQK